MSETKTFSNATLFTRSDFGFGYGRTLCRSVKVETGVKWAQYDNATRVTFVPKGKRSERQFVSYHYGSGVHNPFVLLAGFHPDFAPSAFDDKGDGCSESRHLSCSPEYDYEFNRAFGNYAVELSGEVEILHDERHTKATEAPVEEVAS